MIGIDCQITHSSHSSTSGKFWISFGTFENIFMSKLRDECKSSVFCVVLEREQMFSFPMQLSLQFIEDGSSTIFQSYDESVDMQFSEYITSDFPFLLHKTTFQKSVDLIGENKFFPVVLSVSFYDMSFQEKGSGLQMSQLSSPKFELVYSDEDNNNEETPQHSPIFDINIMPKVKSSIYTNEGFEDSESDESSVTASLHELFPNLQPKRQSEIQPPSISIKSNGSIGKDEWNDMRQEELYATVQALFPRCSQTHNKAFICESTTKIMKKKSNNKAKNNEKSENRRFSISSDRLMHQVYTIDDIQEISKQSEPPKTKLNVSKTKPTSVAFHFNITDYKKRPNTISKFSVTTRSCGKKKGEEKGGKKNSTLENKEDRFDEIMEDNFCDHQPKFSRVKVLLRGNEWDKELSCKEISSVVSSFDGVDGVTTYESIKTKNKQNLNTFTPKMDLIKCPVTSPQPVPLHFVKK